MPPEGQNLNHWTTRQVPDMLFLVNIILERWLHIGGSGETCYTLIRMAFHSTDCTELISPFLCWRTFVLSQALPCYPSRLPRTKSSGPWDSFPRVPQGCASWRGTAGTWDRPQVCPTLHTGFWSDCADNGPALRDGSLFYVLRIFHIFVIVTNREWTVGDMGETLHTPFSTKLSSMWLERVVPYSYPLIFFPAEKVAAFHSWSHKWGVCILHCRMSTPSAAHSVPSPSPVDGSSTWLVQHFSSP